MLFQSVHQNIVEEMTIKEIILFLTERNIVTRY